MGKHIRSTSEFISIGGKQVTQKLKSSTSPSIWGVLLAGAPECDEPPSPKSPGLAHMKDRRHADTAHPGLPNTSIRSSLTLLYLPTLAPLPIPYESPLDWAKNKPIHHYHHSALSPAFFAAEYRPPTNPSRNANSREPLIPSNQALNLALTKASKEANWKKERKNIRTCAWAVSILRRARGRNRCRRASTINLAAFPARILTKTFFLPLPQLIVREEKRRRSKRPCGTTIAPIPAAKCSCQKLTSSLPLSRSVWCGTLSGAFAPAFLLRWAWMAMAEKHEFRCTEGLGKNTGESLGVMRSH